MGRPLRMFEPDGIYFVTNRTLQGRLLMRPSEDTNAIIGGVLAEGLVRYKVEAYNFVFLSNHYHMIIKAPAGALSSFMQFINNNIARKLGDLNDWHGKFWHRRFSAEPILDQEALLGRMKYIFMHGVKEGLVASHGAWPGLTAWSELCQGHSRKFVWPGSIGGNESGVLLQVARLPGFEDLRSGDFAKAMGRLCSDAEGEARAERGGAAFVGARQVLQQDPHNRPARCKRSPRPLCHAVSAIVRQAFIETYRAFVDAYRYASALLRAGAQRVALPPYSYPPPLPYAWRARQPPLGTVILV